MGQDVILVLIQGISGLELLCFQCYKLVLTANPCF